MLRGVLRNSCPRLAALTIVCALAGSVHAQDRVKQVTDLTYPKQLPPVQVVTRPPIEARSVSVALPAIAAPITIPLSVPQAPPKYTKIEIPFLDHPAQAEPFGPTDEAVPTVTAPVDKPEFDQESASAQTSKNFALSVPPPLTEPYWVVDVMHLSRNASTENGLVPVEYEKAIWDALTHSPYVRALQLVPQINEAKVTEAGGAFDPTPFVDSIFNDTSDPVGSTLTTGGPKRLNEHRLDNGLGMRAKNQLGGSAEVSQSATLRDNNSVFLAPKQQADTKMLVKMNQPLMRGAGRTYATSSVRLAQLTVGISQHEATRKLQLHAQSIAGAYWNLYSARAIELQAQRGIVRLTSLRDELRKRAEVDGLESQLKRAEAALARQASNLARAQADVTSATANLRALVNAPEWSGNDLLFMPATPPVDQQLPVDRTSELQSALAFHPDLLAARDRIKSATVRLKVAENELRPTLNLVMEGYLKGLNGDYDLGNSVADQFSQGRPSYSGGLSYQRPYRNLISKSILKQRRLEIQQLLFDLDNTMLVITADVDQALAGLKASYAELEASVKSTLAFDEEVRYLDARWQNAFVESTGPSLLLDELLNAQNQLIQSENAWARAQAEHMIAFAKLQLATGTLLNSAAME